MMAKPLCEWLDGCYPVFQFRGLHCMHHMQAHTFVGCCFPCVLLCAAGEGAVQGSHISICWCCTWEFSLVWSLFTSKSCTSGGHNLAWCPLYWVTYRNELKFIHGDRLQLQSKVAFAIWMHCITMFHLDTWLQVFRSGRAQSSPALPHSCQVFIWDSIVGLERRPDDAVTWMVVMDAWWMDGRWWACGDWKGQEEPGRKPSLYAVVPAAAFAGASVSAIVCPTELVKASTLSNTYSFFVGHLGR